MINIKTLIQKIFDLYFDIPFRLLKFCPQIKNQAISSICKKFSHINNGYISLLTKPKYSDQIHVLTINKRNLPSYAVILQGPVILKDHYTLETLKFYKKIFPDGIIIVSTWEGTDQQFIKAAQELEANVLLNKQPECTGMGNINYQMRSSLAGTRKAKELGAQYILKTRSDQRITIANAFEYFYNLERLFVCDDYWQMKQKERIIFLQGYSGCMFLPFYMTDWLYFGNIDDIIRLFSYEETDIDFQNGRDLVEYQKQLEEKYGFYGKMKICAPEISILYDYLKHRQVDLSDFYTVKKYWEFVKNYAVGIGIEDIGLQWTKYNSSYEENNLTLKYLESDSDQQLITYNWTFENWLGLYMGTLVYTEEFEIYKELRTK